MNYQNEIHPAVRKVALVSAFSKAELRFPILLKSRQCIRIGPNIDTGIIAMGS
jgi:hypothetical protein